jgi:hypothetical protein
LRFLWFITSTSIAGGHDGNGHLALDENPARWERKPGAIWWFWFILAADDYLGDLRNVVSGPWTTFPRGRSDGRWAAGSKSDSSISMDSSTLSAMAHATNCVWRNRE